MKKGQINILIVDDDESSRAGLAEVVKRAGFKVTEASKVEEALNSVRIKPVHGAIIDCMLPRMNGIQLVEELRKGRFGNGPVVFVSGIFKDKAFANDAIKKTQALEYFTKPVPMAKMMEVLEASLIDLIDAPKIPLHALLSKPYASDRERLKALESIEEVTGLDLPLIMSILMDAESTGFLNVVSNDGDISGITFVTGGITKVDTADSGKMVGGLLIERGFLTQKDFEELPEKKRQGDVLKHLINESLISPHAGSVVKVEQVVHDLRGLFVDKPVQINFVPERIRDKSSRVEATDLTPLFHEVIKNLIDLAWLEKFYHDWMDHPMRLGPEFTESHQAIDLAVADKLPNFVEGLKEEPTINEVLENQEFDKETLLKAVHLIALRRLIVFDDVKRAKNLGEQLERLKVILKEIQNKNPFQIFEYFGTGENPAVRDVERVYKEFARANHPDMLPQNASDEIKDTVHKVYAMVSDAYDVLTNEGKRDKFVHGLKQEEAEKQLRAEGVAEEAMVQLRRGRAKNALEKLEEAYKLHPNTTNLIYLCWAKLKAHTGDVPFEVQQEVQRLLEKVSHEDRRSPNYLFVSGLMKKAGGDFEGAQAQLDKALTIDTNFLDARRELSSLKRAKQSSGDNTFTGELTSIVGRLFKKQAKK